MESCEGFSWGYEECTVKFLGICFKKELRHEVIKAEFKDKIECKKLYDMNFILQVRQKPI